MSKTILNTLVIIFISVIGFLAYKQENLSRIQGKNVSASETISVVINSPRMYKVMYTGEDIKDCGIYQRLDGTETSNGMTWLKHIGIAGPGQMTYLTRALCNFPDVYNVSLINDPEMIIIKSSNGHDLFIKPSVHFGSSVVYKDNGVIYNSRVCDFGNDVENEYCENNKRMMDIVSFLANSGIIEHALTDIRYEKEVKGSLVPTQEAVVENFGHSYADSVGNENVIFLSKKVVEGI